MVGFPRWFNTRQDVELCLKEYPDQMKAKLREWKKNCYCWQPGTQLVDDDAGIEDETHMIETRDDGTRWQIALVEDSNGHLARLRITGEDADKMCN
jgi:hypothetical protein